MKKNSNAKAAS